MGKNLIITEEERNEILNLHNSYIFEAPGDTVLGNQGTPVVGATASGPTIANTVSQPSVPPQQTQQPTKIAQLQNKLNQKFNSGLKVDGKWGVNTANAVLRALKTTSPATKPPTATQQPATQQPATQQPTQKLPTLPAGTAQRHGQPTQLAGQNK